MKSIMIAGRGGEGIKTVGELLSEAFVSEGKYVIGYPLFGPERRGMPVYFVIKYSNEIILDRTQSEKNDYIMATDKNLPILKHTKGKMIFFDAPSLMINSEFEKTYYLLGRFLRVSNTLRYETLEKTIKNKFGKTSALEFLKMGFKHEKGKNLC